MHWIITSENVKTPLQFIVRATHDSLIAKLFAILKKIYNLKWRNRSHLKCKHYFGKTTSRKFWIVPSPCHCIWKTNSTPAGFIKKLTVSWSLRGENISFYYDIPNIFITFSLFFPSSPAWSANLSLSLVGSDVRVTDFQAMTEHLCRLSLVQEGAGPFHSSFPMP